MSQHPGQISRATSLSTGCRKKYLTHVQGEQNHENINISTNYCHRSFPSSLFLQVCALAHSFLSKSLGASPARAPSPPLHAFCHEYPDPAVLTPRWGSSNCVATILD